MLRLLAALAMVGLLCASASCDSKRGSDKLRALVKPDGSIWVRADLYMQGLGGKATVEQDGELVVICRADGSCVPLRPPDDVATRTRSAPVPISGADVGYRALGCLLQHPSSVLRHEF